MQITEAIILAGGLGTRLRPMISKLPKCMAPIHGKPFIHFVIEHLMSQGIKKIVFSLGYKYDYFLNFLENFPNLKYEIAVEDTPLGTGGAIKFASQKITSSNVLITNGDTLFKINLKQLSDLHFKNKSACTLTLKAMTNFDRYGTVEINDESRIIKFQEKKHTAKGFINGGVSILNIDNFIRQCKEEKFSFEKHFLETQITSNYFYGLKQDAYFIDIGIPEDYIKAQKKLNL